MKNENGFTVIEIVIVLAMVFFCSIVISLIYVAYHFISKYW